MKDIIYYFLVLFLLTISVWSPIFARDISNYPEESDGKGKESREAILNEELEIIIPEKRRVMENKIAVLPVSNT